jgi:hypothetical protein
MTADTTASASSAEPRAFVLLKSRGWLDLLNPGPHAWTDDDTRPASRAPFDPARASRSEHPLSAAQRSLTVLTIREPDGALTLGVALCELLHDATEFILGCDCITPLKAQLGEVFRALDARVQSGSTHAIDSRNGRPRLRRSTSASTVRSNAPINPHCEFPSPTSVPFPLSMEPNMMSNPDDDPALDIDPDGDATA